MITTIAVAAQPRILELLKTKRTLVGIDAPVVAWVAAGIVLIWFVGALIRLSAVYFQTVLRMKRLTRHLSGVAGQIVRRPGEGATLEDLEKTRKAFEAVRKLQPIWDRNELDLIPQRSQNGTTYFAEASSDKSISIEDITSGFNAEFYRALPGVITGIGLCATFLALLVALLDVRLQGTRVEGLPLLIEGLSGKFLSSIAALVAATLLIVFEKNFFHRLDRHRMRLVHALDRIFPRLTVGQVLMQMHREISEQTLSFKVFNTDLATTLRKGVSEGVTPTMDRMVTAVNNLNELIRQEQATKADSLASQVETVLSNLQRSLETTLREMGQSFTSSLSGSTMNQFEKLAESLGGASRLIEAMNTQSQGTQAALQDVVRLARTSTEEQLALGRSQVEELTAVLRELMRQLNESASSSLGQMSATLTTVVHDLSEKVTELSSQLAITVTDASGRATSAASSVVEEVGRWSAKNERQLSDLLERHGKQLDRVTALGGALETATVRFTATLSESAGLLNDLKLASSNTATAIKAIENASRDISDAQSGFLEAALAVSAHTENLSNVTQSHKQVWQQMQSTLAAYEETFQKAQKASSELLAQISAGAGHFSTITKEHFEALLTYTNTSLADAVQKMHSLTEELNEVLDEVSETLAPLRKPPTPPTAPPKPTTYVRR